jgi:hypothetical protein
MTRSAIGLLAIVLACPAAFGQATQPAPAQRLFYVATNLLLDENVSKTVDLIDRAAKAGYTGIALADSKFMMWDRLDEKYIANVRKVRQACHDKGIQCIACVIPIGYSNGVCAHDPNLAEGLPVIDAPFVVRGGKLVPEDDSPGIVNGSFEAHKGDTPDGWAFIDKPGKISFIDNEVKFDGAASLRMQDIGVNDPTDGHARAHQSLKLKPFRYYHVSLAVKTQDFEAADQFRVALLGGKENVNLQYQIPRVEKTQDWKRVDMVFNTLEFPEVQLYVGVWHGKAGKLWMDDVKIEPAGWVNIIRRDGAPLKITSPDGKTVHAEGKDFTAIKDAKLANDPYAGSFSAWHDAPQPAVIEGGALKDGQKVLANYYHPAIIFGSQVMVCLAEPKVNDILAWQIAQVYKHLQPDGYFMQHDEVRAQGYDLSCANSKKTPAELLADNVKRSIEIIRKEDAGKAIYVWSDMFDPSHNARKTGRYYLVKGEGPWHGAWKGLPADVIVANWSQGKPDTLKWFADLGNQQILAGYYDAAPSKIVGWLNQAREVKGVIGVMYTTWQDQYKDLEEFGKLTGAAGGCSQD